MTTVKRILYLIDKLSCTNEHVSCEFLTIAEVKTLSAEIRRLTPCSRDADCDGNCNKDCNFRND